VWKQELSVCEQLYQSAHELHKNKDYAGIVLNTKQLRQASEKLETIRVSADILACLLEQNKHDTERDARELAARINAVVEQFMRERAYI
jgi:hypothetical protein